MRATVPCVSLLLLPHSLILLNTNETRPHPSKEGRGTWQGHAIEAPPQVDYTLPLPSSIDATYPFAARLDPANAEVGPSAAVVRHVTPDEGFIKTLLNLDSEYGVHADVFWRMFHLQP